MIVGGPILEADIMRMRLKIFISFNTGPCHGNWMLDDDKKGSAIDIACTQNLIDLEHPQEDVCLKF